MPTHSKRPKPITTKRPSLLSVARPSSQPHATARLPNNRMGPFTCFRGHAPPPPTPSVRTLHSHHSAGALAPVLVQIANVQRGPLRRGVGAMGWVGYGWVASSSLQVDMGPYRHLAPDHTLPGAGLSAQGLPRVPSPCTTLLALHHRDGRLQPDTLAPPPQAVGVDRGLRPLPLNLTSRHPPPPPGPRVLDHPHLVRRVQTEGADGGCGWRAWVRA